MIGRFTVAQADGRPVPVAFPTTAGLIGTIAGLTVTAYTQKWGLTPPRAAIATAFNGDDR